MFKDLDQRYPENFRASHASLYQRGEQNPEQFQGFRFDTAAQLQSNVPPSEPELKVIYRNPEAHSSYSQNVFPIKRLEALSNEGQLVEGDFRDLLIPELPVILQINGDDVQHEAIYLRGMNRTVFIPLQDVPKIIEGGES